MTRAHEVGNPFDNPLYGQVVDESRRGARDVRRLFWAFAGADVDTLKDPRAKVDRGRYAMIGFAVLLTGVLAGISGAYALYTVFGDRRVAAGGGLLWGLIVLNIDRLLVSTICKADGMGRALATAAPRLALALTVGMVVSKPLELRLFAREIDAHLADRERVAAAAARAQADTGYGEIGSLKTQIEEARSRVEAAEARTKPFYEAFIGEAEGTSGTGKKGKGPVAAEKEEAYRESQRETQTVRTAANAEIAQDQAQIDRLKSERDESLLKASLARRQADGFLGRLEALEEMKRARPTIFWIDLAVTLLFVLVEVTPLLAKLLAPVGNYERLLQATDHENALAIEAVKSAADEEMRIRRHLLKECANERLGILREQVSAALASTRVSAALQAVHVRVGEEIVRLIEVFLMNEARLFAQEASKPTSRKEARKLRQEAHRQVAKRRRVQQAATDLMSAFRAKVAIWKDHLATAPPAPEVPPSGAGPENDGPNPYVA